MNRIDWILWNKIEEEFEEYVRKLEDKHRVDLTITLNEVVRRKTEE